MRKTYYYYLMLMLTGASASAKHISPEEAGNVAAEFFRVHGLQSQIIAQPVEVSSATTRGTDDGISDAFYVFNAADKKGFVIVSGDDRSAKILGYSDKGSFNISNMPPQLKSLLDGYSANVGTILAGKGVHSSWNTTRGESEPEGILLETATWGQDYPYNTMCPTIEGSHAQTGCVATAMAIMMKYNKWPESYDWDSMPMNTPEEPIESLSKLMADAGEAVYMNYGLGESGAMMAWVGNKLYSDFGYSPECQYILSKQFEESRWTEMVKESLERGEPLIYSGSGTGGHAFIIDGYVGDNYHINWGWDGSCNGYYALNELKPSEYMDFSEDTGMVLNIVPDKTGIDYSDCFVDYNLWAGGDVAEPMNISVENVVKGRPFHVIQGAITIPGHFSGEIGMALVSADNKIKEVLKTEHFQSWDEPVGTEFRFMDLIVTVDIDPTDCIYLVAKHDDDDNYKLMRGTMVSPSNISVSDNKPRYGKVKFNIGENVRFDCSIGSKTDSELGLLPAGTKEVNILRGMDLRFEYGPMYPDENTSAVFIATGKMIYGDMIMADSDFGYSFKISEEHEVTVKTVTHKDVSFDLKEAGTLKNMITAEDANAVRNLTLSGKVNFEDLVFIRDNMPCVRVLDMKNVTIEACRGKDEKMGTEADYMADEMPSFGLVNLHNDYIQEFILPDNLTRIGDDSMVHFKIEQITLPAGVTSIGVNAFYGNHYLKALELLNPEPVQIADCVFVDTRCPEEGILYVPEGSASKFRQTPVWQDFSQIIEGKMPASGVESVELENETDLCDVYGIDGSLVLSNCSKKDMQQLTPGIYIVRQGSKTSKVMIK